MKKLVAIASTMVMTMGAYAGVQAATAPTASPETQSIVTVSSDDNKHSASLVNDTTDKESASIKNVIYAVDRLNSKGASASQELTVESSSTKGLASDVFLRLSTESSSKNALYDATKLIKSYDIVVKNGDRVVYNSKASDIQVESPKAGTYVLDIFLDRFNEGEDKASETYSIDIKLPADATASEIKNIKKVNWEVASDPVEADATAVPVPNITAAPEVIVPTHVPATVTAAPSLPTPTPKVITPVPDATATPAPSETLETKDEKIVGNGEKEIKPGTYTVTAKEKEAVVKIYDKDGKLKSQIVIDENKPSQVVTLVAGDRIQNDGKVNLTEYKSPTSAPSSSAKTANTTTTAKKTTNPKATVAPSSKSNPKTGDTAPIAGVAALAVFALGMIAYPALEKKRKDN